MAVVVLTKARIGLQVLACERSIFGWMLRALAMGLIMLVAVAVESAAESAPDSATDSTAPTQNKSLPMQKLIELVRAQGHDIVYSSGLITSTTVVEVDGIGLAQLRRALRPIGLELRRVNNKWLVVRASRVSEPAVPRAQISQSENARSTAIEHVIVYGSLHSFPPRGRAEAAHRLDANDLEVSPALAGDALQVINRLPGVASIGLNASPRIRGGIADEVLILYDGVELLEPFHLADFQGGYSSIDSRAIGSIDVYTGGFPVRYSNRMSGVIDMRSNQAASPAETELGYSNFSTFVRTSGRAKNSGLQWRLAYREGDLEQLTEYLDARAQQPKYRDVTALVDVDVSQKNDLRLGMVAAADDVAFADAEESASSKIDNRYFWAKLSTALSNALQSSYLLSYADIDRRKRENSAIEDDGKGGFFRYDQKIRQLKFCIDNRYVAERHISEFGLQLSHGRADYNYQANFDRGPLASVVGSQRQIVADSRLRPSGWSGGIYFGHEVVRGKFTVQPSVRWDFQDYYFASGTQHFSPRLGLAYELDPRQKFTFSVGRFYQPEGLHELQLIDGVNKFFKPQTANQLVLGYEYSEGRAGFVGELYSKEYGRLKPRYENLFNPFVLLPELEPDRVRLEPLDARTRGVDLELDYVFSSSFSGVVRYSYMQAQDKIDRSWIDRRWAQTHSAGGELVWQGDKTTAAIAIAWHSGWRTARMPARVDKGATIALRDVLNNQRLKNYFSIDIGASHSLEFNSFSLQLHADLTNISERDNLAGIDFNIEEDGNDLLLSPDNERLLPLVFSLGAVASF